jgi:hypothetical protein
MKMTYTPCSPILFNMYMNEMIFHWNQIYSIGIEIYDDTIFNTLVFILNELCFWTLSIVWCLKNKQN